MYDKEEVDKKTLAGLLNGLKAAEPHLYQEGIRNHSWTNGPLMCG
ncbi:MAG: hypothetical protein R3B47_01880 [Bacteroidia bacterium]